MRENLLDDDITVPLQSEEDEVAKRDMVSLTEPPGASHIAIGRFNGISGNAFQSHDQATDVSVIKRQ